MTVSSTLLKSKIQTLVRSYIKVHPIHACEERKRHKCRCNDGQVSHDCFRQEKSVEEHLLATAHCTAFRLVRFSVTLLRLVVLRAQMEINQTNGNIPIGVHDVREVGKVFMELLSMPVRVTRWSREISLRRTQ